MKNFQLSAGMRFLSILLLLTVFAILLGVFPVSGETLDGRILTGRGSVFPDSLKVREIDYGDINALRWVDEEGRRPESFVEWQMRTGEPGPFEAKTVLEKSPDKSADYYVKFLIIVNTDLYPLITGSVDQYILDLNDEGYEVELVTSSGGTAEDLRAFLQEKYYAGMKGCVFIGDLPVAWYEIYNCFDYYENEQFPCDLFYMDLDGEFVDADRDGLYDHHNGEVTPEIWMGRLTASPHAQGARFEDSIIINYFDKNHLYRTGQLDLNKRALVYIDDDWAGEGTYWDDNVGLTYDVRTLVYDEWTTWADDYEDRLDDNYEFIEVCVHSSAYSHSFKNPNEEWSTTTNIEVNNIGPVAHFYNLFACSNARFTTTGNMGGCYIFGDEYGLASVGSTKTGSMLYFEYFYYPLGRGKTIGESMRDWFIDIAWDGSYEFDKACWHYGMTLQGDPTLTVSGWNVKFISSQQFGWAPFNVDFYGISPHSVDEWRWTFGDGDTALAQAPSHTYEEPGIYNVSLQVLTDGSHLYTYNEPDYIVVLADTLIAEDRDAQAGVTFEYTINLTNNVPLYRLQLPLEYGGPLDLKFEGYTVEGCRGTVFDAFDYLNYDGNNRRFCMNLDTDGNSLAPGSGPLIKFKFKIQGGGAGQSNTIILDGYNDFEPVAYSFPVIYQPALESGSITYNASVCCIGSAGNVDCSTEETPDISDITRLIDYLYLSHNPLCCLEEADSNGSGGEPDISDITALIDFLYLAHNPLANCP
jgi:PKD repeat protein